MYFNVHINYPFIQHIDSSFWFDTVNLGWSIVYTDYNFQNENVILTMYIILAYVSFHEHHFSINRGYAEMPYFIWVIIVCMSMHLVLNISYSVCRITSFPISKLLKDLNSIEIVFLF